MESLQGKTALVTGASRGLGAAIALDLARRGANVAVNYFAKQDRAEQLCDQIRSKGGQATPFYADVRQEADVANMVRGIEAVYGQVDIVVLNATGVQPLFSLNFS
jgi:3-oxoacyl-[acyl-carrier protein] reductase